MTNSTEQSTEESNAYVDKLLGALKQLQQLTGAEVVIKSAISNTKNLEVAFRDCVDIDACITSLKKMRAELLELTSTKQQKLHDLVVVAMEKATLLHMHWTDHCQTYFQDTVVAVRNIRESLIEFSCERKETLLEAYTTCQEALLSLTSRIRSTESFVRFKDIAREKNESVTQKLRKSEKGHILHDIKDKVIGTAICLDDRYALWQKVSGFAEVAVQKGKIAIENKKVAGAIDVALFLDNKLAQGTVNSVVGKGYDLVEAGAAYWREEIQVARQRQQNSPTVHSVVTVGLVNPRVNAITEEENVPCVLESEDIVIPAEPKAPDVPESEDNDVPSEPKAPNAPESEDNVSTTETEEPNVPEPKDNGSTEETDEPKAPEQKENLSTAEPKAPYVPESEDIVVPEEQKIPSVPESEDNVVPEEQNIPSALEREDNLSTAELKAPYVPKPKDNVSTAEPEAKSPAEETLTALRLTNSKSRLRSKGRKPFAKVKSRASTNTAHQAKANATNYVEEEEHYW